MSEYEVTVYTTVKEIYVVQAESEEEAMGNWSEEMPVLREAVDADVQSAVEVTEDD